MYIHTYIYIQAHPEFDTDTGHESLNKIIDYVETHEHQTAIKARESLQAHGQCVLCALVRDSVYMNRFILAYHIRTHIYIYVYIQCVYMYVFMCACVSM